MPSISTFQNGAKNLRKLFAPIAALAVLLTAVDCAAECVATNDNQRSAISAGGEPTFICRLPRKNEQRFAIAAGGSHSLVLSKKGKVYAAGGKLGLGGAIGSGAFVSAFTKAASLEGNKIVAIAAGEYHSFAIDENGKLYAAGENRYGELGFGDKKHRAEFTQVSDLNGKKILVIAAGRNHSLVLDANGRAYASGYNEYGQLGLGDNADRAAFAEIAFLRDKQIARVAAGAYHLLALGADGKVYGTGRNWHGELGLNDIESRNSFALVTSLEGKKIVAIAAGDFHSFALDSDGKLYAAGMNNRGKLGLGAPGERKAFTPVSSLSEKKIVAIAAGDNHSLAIGADGKVYAAGANRYGQLGLDDKEDRWTFTEVTSFEGKKIIAIAAGRNHSLALDANGRAYASGYNEYGQLGLGDKKNRDVFTPVPLGNR